MGHRPHAVLAYGYDLTTHVYDYNAPDPAWFTDDEVDWCGNAERALLKANGVDIPEYIDPDWFRETCGVELMRLGTDDGGAVLLAAKKHQTDWDTNQVIPHFALPDDVDDRLKWALGVLGIDPGERLPEWILAAYYS